MTEVGPPVSADGPGTSPRGPSSIWRRILSRAAVFWVVVASLAAFLGILVVLIALSIVREPAEWDAMRWLLAIGFVLPIAAGLIALLWYGRTVRGAVAERAQAEESFRTVASTMGDGVITIDGRSRIQFVNGAVERIFGYRREELIGNELTMLMPEGFRARHRAGIQRYVSTGRRSVPWESLEFPGRHKDGHEIPLEISIGEHFIGGERVLTGIVRDVSERRRAEERFHMAVESAPNAMVMVNSEGKILLVNTRAEAMFGYRRGELIGQRVEMLVPQRFRDIHPSHRRRFFAEPQERPMGAGRELYCLRKDGSEFPVEIGLNPIQTPEGTLVLSAVVDITERKRAEQALAQSEARFRRLIESAPDGIFVLDAQGTILEANPAAERLLARPRADVVGRRLTELAAPERAPILRQYLEDRATGSSSDDAYEGTWLRPSGERVSVQLTSQVVPSPRSPSPLVAVVRDVSEQRDMQRRLVESERWASMGRLASFVAHEINTPLTNISLLTASVARRVADPEVQERLKKISAQGKIAANITQELLRFARPGVINPTDTDLRELVKGVIEQADAFRKPTTEIRPEIGTKPVVCAVDALRIHEVLVNLLKNAYEATPSGRVKVSLEDRGMIIVVSVTDTGSGMPPEVRARLFEPFFTTKKKGEGTGLGLAIARNFVVSHGGDLLVSSEVGKGSTFTVILPRQATGPPPVPPAGEGAPSG